MQKIHRAARTGGRRAAASAAALALVLVAASAASAAGVNASSSGAKSALSGVVNVNTASTEELQLLPGVGTSRAAAIVEVRKSRGGFKSVDELTEVKGIGPAMLERMRPHLTLSGQTTARVVDGSSKPGAATDDR